MKKTIHLLIALILYQALIPAADLTITDGNFTATIKRDNWGVPHIYGKRDADVSFGLAYAHAQDDFTTIQDVLIATRGKLSEIYGIRLWSTHTLKNLFRRRYNKINGIFRVVNDYYVHLMNFWEDVETKYEAEIPDDVKKICRGYAAGLNLFAKDQPDLANKKLLPFHEKDIIVGFSHRIPLFIGLDGVIRKLGKEKRPEIIGGYFSPSAITPWPMDMVASNVFAVSPSRSDDGYTRLMINTHQPWTGPVAWYEAHVVSEEGWDFFGGLFPGTPTPLIGHNPDLGWSHTVNDPDLVDVYQLTINPKNKNQYWYDGQWENMEVRNIKIKVKLWGSFSWKLKRQVKESIHGPVLEFSHGTYALRIATRNEFRFVEQWYRMTRSRNIDEFKEAMAMNAIPMFNTGYADREGNIYYLYNAKIPLRKNGYDWQKILPGETSTNLWTTFVPFDSLPQVTNPPSGFFQNCNSSPYLATGDSAEMPLPLPNWAGVERHQTSRALRALETYGADTSISRQEFFNYKYDHRYSKKSQIARTRDRFISDMENDTNRALKPALELLANWDLEADSTNKAAALAFMVLPMSFKDKDLNYELDAVIRNLQESINYLTEKFGTVEVPLGRVFRLVRGNKQYPLSGGPGLLRAIYCNKVDGIYQGRAGDCYVQAVEWGPDGEFNAWSIHQFGSATLDSASPHYSDQAELFHREEMKIIRPQ
tara:strand:+ start:345 stop:2459 length:2115 start_codon:yes stop_codon:yes gene_type:complete